MPALSVRRLASREHPLETIEAFTPALVVELRASLRGEDTLIDYQLSRLAQILERDRHDRLPIVRVGLLPSKRVGQARRLYLAESPERWKRSPSGGCIAIRYLPPGRRSSSMLGALNPLGPHHFASSSGAVCALYTARRVRAEFARDAQSDHLGPLPSPYVEPKSVEPVVNCAVAGGR